jgi:uncharacterized protein (DUF58 family)
MKSENSEYYCRVKEWLVWFFTPPRTLKITSAGWYFIGLTFAVGFAAVNSGNNLLYIILGAMLSFITASGIMSNIALKNLEIRRDVSGRLFAKTPTLYQLGVTNQKKYLSSYLLFVKDDAPFLSGALLQLIGPKEEAISIIEAVFPRRGPFKFGKVMVSTSFPFGIFIKGMKRDIDGEILVLPRIRDIDPDAFDFKVWEGEIILNKSGQGGEPWGITEYFPGDNPRHIHWKSSAKRDDILKKEFTEESERKITIRLIMLDTLSEDEIEYKIEAAASVAVRFIRGGYAVGLILGSEFLNPKGGAGQLDRILEMLALFDGGKVGDYTVFVPSGTYNEENFGAVVDI